MPLKINERSTIWAMVLREGSWERRTGDCCLTWICPCFQHCDLWNALSGAVGTSASSLQSLPSACTTLHLTGWLLSLLANGVWIWPQRQHRHKSPWDSFNKLFPKLWVGMRSNFCCHAWFGIQSVESHKSFRIWIITGIGFTIF